MHKKALSLLLAVIVVMAVGITGLDGLVRSHLQRDVEDKIEAKYGGQADVQISGWPVSMQAIANKIHHVDVHMSNFQYTDADIDLPVRSADIQLTGVSKIGDPKRIQADNLWSDIQIGWSELSSLVGMDMHYVAGNRVALSTSVSILSKEVHVDIEADLSVKKDGTLVWKNPSFSVDDTMSLPTVLVDRAVKNSGLSLKLPNAERIEYQKIDMDSDHVSIIAVGENVGLGTFD